MEAEGPVRQEAEVLGPKARRHRARPREGQEIERRPHLSSGIWPVTELAPAAPAKTVPGVALWCGYVADVIGRYAQGGASAPFARGTAQRRRRSVSSGSSDNVEISHVTSSSMSPVFLLLVVESPFQVQPAIERQLLAYRTMKAPQALRGPCVFGAPNEPCVESEFLVTGSRWH